MSKTGHLIKIPRQSHNVWLVYGAVNFNFPVSNPSVVGSIITHAGLDFVSKNGIPADVIELRADALENEELPIGILGSRKRPVLLTVRIQGEGGQSGQVLTIDERRKKYLDFLPHVEAIDIELATAAEMRSVIERAKQLNKTVVLSAHFLARSATPHELSTAVEKFKAFGGDILKVASLIEKPENFQQLADLLKNHPSIRMAVMGVGPHAATSRSQFAALGSSLVYGYLDTPAAPGQPSAMEMKEMVNSLKLKDARFVSRDSMPAAA